MTEQEFIDFMATVGDLGELCFKVAVGKETESTREEMKAFIEDNHLSCLHLWGKSEQGHKDYKDFEKLIYKAIEMNKK